MEVSRRPKRVKLFAGIALEKPVQRRLATLAERLRRRGLDARFDAAEKYHLTLAFLGWVDLGRVDEVVQVLHVVAAAHQPFDLRLDHIGAFPHERRPRVVWIGSRAQPPAFRNLAHSVRSAYETLGFEFKDDAVAHVTIARVKAAVSPLPTVSAFNPIGVNVSRLTLFESLPAAGTTRYETRARAALSAV